MMLIVSLGLIPLGLYTGYLGWLAYDEPRTFREAPTLPETGGVVGALYKVAGDAEGMTFSPTAYAEVRDALQYQVSREKKDASGDGWTQVAVVEAMRNTGVSIQGRRVAVSDAARILGPTEEATRSVSDAERLRITWTGKGNGGLVAYGIFDGKDLVDGRFQRVVLATPAGERELLDSLAETGWIKALVLGVVSLVSLLMAGFAVRSALR